MAACRPVRILGISGSASDRRFALARLARHHGHDPVDVIIGDWLSEANMATSAGRLHDGIARGGYEKTFVSSFKAAVSDLARHKIKVVVNAGASDTKGLYSEVCRVLQDQNILDYTAAWIEGDEVLDKILDLHHDIKFLSLDGKKPLDDFLDRNDAIFAHAYLGCFGIAKALEHADVIVCGRVSDASMVIGPAVWWHKWKRTQLDLLAKALVAGHLIECSTYVCGGNFSGFKSLKSWKDIGYPIAEISEDGEIVVTKEKGSGGEVSPQTCTAQLVYEIQGPWYFNSDVTADLSGVEFEYVAADKVRLKGIKGMPAPPTTKVGITALGGYQAELHYYLVGLDLEEKAKMLEAQIRHLLRPHSHKFTLFEFMVLGTAIKNPRNQNSATVDMRIVVQGRTREDIGTLAFLGPVSDCQMQTYPGATMHLDLRLGIPRPIYEYFPTLIPQRHIQQIVHHSDGQIFNIKKLAESDTRIYPLQQPSHDAFAGVEREFGLTRTLPLGTIVHGRSGDKGSNANVGFWVRRKDEFVWLKSYLSIARLKDLLGDDYAGGRVDRFEFPGILAVHFLLHDHLDRGVACTGSVDFLGKNVAEYLRAKHVEIPLKFVDRGKI